MDAMRTYSPKLSKLTLYLFFERPYSLLDYLVKGLTYYTKLATDRLHSDGILSELRYVQIISEVGAYAIYLTIFFDQHYSLVVLLRSDYSNEL